MRSGRDGRRRDSASNSSRAATALSSAVDAADAESTGTDRAWSARTRCARRWSIARFCAVRNRELASPAASGRLHSLRNASCARSSALARPSDEPADQPHHAPTLGREERGQRCGLDDHRRRRGRCCRLVATGRIPVWMRPDSGPLRLRMSVNTVPRT